MTIIDSLKSLIGYSGSDLDMVFAILAVIIIMFFVHSLFNILISSFKRSF